MELSLGKADIAILNEFEHQAVQLFYLCYFS